MSRVKSLLAASIFAALIAAPPALSAAERGNEPGRYFPEPAAVRVRVEDGTICRSLVYIPAGEGPHPVVLLLNGGGGESTDALSFFRDGGAVYAPLGYAVFAPDFREGALGGPALMDVLAALEYIRRHVRLDENRVVIEGWAEGAYLAMLAATKTEVAGVIASSGFYDAAEYAAGLADERKESRRRILDLTEAELGSPLRDSDAYRMRSPLFFAERITGRVLLFHGRNDNVTNWNESQEMANALVAAGIPTDFYILDGEGRSPKLFEGAVLDIKMKFLSALGLPFSVAEPDQSGALPS
ncbi:MAG: prolyl oligopeptidase family serine peptidase [bacterium]